MRTFFISVLTALCATGFAQQHSASSIFAHNDYEKPLPFYDAYGKQVGYIEADVFLEGNDLLVAHTKQEIKKERTLEELYLRPLERQVKINQGDAYASGAPLTLMIDIKSDGPSTLARIVKVIKQFPLLTSCKKLSFTISGNVPDPATWSQYPAFITFDGRPNIKYTAEQLQRVNLISTSFKEHSSWNGKGLPIEADRAKIASIIGNVHSSGKKIRFWAIPDFANSWLVLMNMGVDVINTDKVAAAHSFIQNKSSVSFQNTITHQTYSPKYHQSDTPPKNIILMIGDGMGLTQINSGYTANKGKLNIFLINNIGFSTTESADSYITDSAAGGTAMASGEKTNNRFIGMNPKGEALVPITNILHDEQYRTAIISSGDITDATPAAFYASQRDRSYNEAIAYELLQSNVDISIGGGSKWFSNRKDSVNIFRGLENAGYMICKDFKSLESINAGRFIVIDDTSVVSIKNGRGKFLSRSINKTLKTFSKDKRPFFMMAEGAQIDYGGHANNMEYVVREMLDFDEAVGEAMKFVDNNRETLLIVTADHETGGLTLVGGNTSDGYVHGNFSTTDHTAVMVPVFAYGPGAELFRGVYPNTQIFYKIVKGLLRIDYGSPAVGEH
jgi:alkaline phosphatase